jgi:hypothetical protein
MIEGVNFQTINQMTLHSGSTCSITPVAAGKQNGTTISTDCNEQDSSSGCSITSGNSHSMMNDFNSASGGVHVMQWTDNGIRMWLFNRNNIPPSIQNKNTMPNVCEFGTPDAYFTGCNFNSNFASNHLVFTNTFCGDWAGASGVFPTAQCGNDCPTYVANNPTAYAQS